VDDRTEIIQRIADTVYSAIQTQGGITGSGEAIRLFSIPATKDDLYYAASYCRKMAKGLPREKLSEIKTWSNAAIAIDQEMTYHGHQYPDSL